MTRLRLFLLFQAAISVSMRGMKNGWNTTYCEDKVNSQDRRDHNEDARAEHQHESKFATPRYIQRPNDWDWDEDDAKIR
jgi:hypothetical protein